jgi:hypothetical protein
MKSPSLRIKISTLAILAVTAIVGFGCGTPGEGDRCNPSLSHDECSGDLVCTQPPNCPENYCCPANGTSSNPNCQPGCDPCAYAASLPNGGATCIAQMAAEAGAD